MTNPLVFGFIGGCASVLLGFAWRWARDYHPTEGWIVTTAVGVCGSLAVVETLRPHLCP